MLTKEQEELLREQARKTADKYIKRTAAEPRRTDLNEDRGPRRRRIEIDEYVSIKPRHRPR